MPSAAPGPERQRTAAITAAASSGTCGRGTGRPTVRPTKYGSTSGARRLGTTAMGCRKVCDDRTAEKSLRCSCSYWVEHLSEHLRDAGWVARKFETSRRRDDVGRGRRLGCPMNAAEPSDHDTAGRDAFIPGKSGCWRRRRAQCHHLGRAWGDLARARRGAGRSQPRRARLRSLDQHGRGERHRRHKVIPGSRIVADPDQVARRYDPA
jgi:hypothetical protein